jgi:hypothetical protein
MHDLLTIDTPVTQIEDAVFNTFQAAIDAHNAEMAELGPFIRTTTDYEAPYIISDDTVDQDELDEFGIPDARKVMIAAETIGFPLRFRGSGLQWTYMHLKRATAAELARAFQAHLDADVRYLLRDIKRAIFSPTNAAFFDRFHTRKNLNLKALLNADGMRIPMGPDGTTFDAATHTHYVGAAAPTSAAFKTLIDTVQEHGGPGDVIVYINRAQEGAVRAFPNTDFQPYTDARLIPAPGGTTLFARGDLDTARVNNRAIGLLHGAEVRVKPWIPANYAFAFMSGAVPLRRRIRTAQDGNFGLLFENESYPLRARAIGREYGIGVFERTGAACIQLNSATYSAPAFNA